MLDADQHHRQQRERLIGLNRLWQARYDRLRNRFKLLADTYDASPAGELLGTEVAWQIRKHLEEDE